MYVRKLLGLFAAVALISACSELPTEPAPLDADLLSAAADANPVIGSASGSGHAECAAGPAPQCFPGGALRTFSFNAQVHADGTVTGRYQHNNREIGAQVKADLECVNFNFLGGNRAWMIGTITHSDDPGLPVGAKAGFAVGDNGEGGGAAPDQITGLGLAPPPVVAFLCSGAGPNDGSFAFFAFDIMSGNIQVRAP